MASGSQHIDRLCLSTLPKACRRELSDGIACFFVSACVWNPKKRSVDALVLARAVLVVVLAVGKEEHEQYQDSYEW